MQSNPIAASNFMAASMAEAVAQAKTVENLIRGRKFRANPPPEQMAAAARRQRAQKLRNRANAHQGLRNRRRQRAMA